MVSTQIEVWIATFLYIAWFSQLYKRNILSTFTEYLLVGMSSAIITVMAFWNLYGTVRQSASTGNIWIIIPLILGIGIFGRLTTQFAWAGRWSVSLIVGVSAAMAARGAVESEIFSQIVPSVTNFIVPGDLFATLNGVIIMIGMITTIFYFIYFVKHQGPVGSIVGKMAFWGRAFMMLFFGASVGQMFVNRANYLIGIARHILSTTLGLGI
jgi:hypothetical protein